MDARTLPELWIAVGPFARFAVVASGALTLLGLVLLVATRRPGPFRVLLGLAALPLVAGLAGHVEGLWIVLAAESGDFPDVDRYARAARRMVVVPAVGALATIPVAVLALVGLLLRARSAREAPAEASPGLEPQDGEELWR